MRGCFWLALWLLAVWLAMLALATQEVIRVMS